MFRRSSITVANAGASIEHPHAQLVALDFVPPRVEMLLQRFDNAGRDLLGGEIAAVANGPHVISCDDATVVWCPPAATSPFMMRAALVDAQPRFDTARGAELHAIAVALRNVLARLGATVGEVGYNVVFNTAPGAGDTLFHWWLDIIPRTIVLAGFELGTGLFVNVVDPALAAEALREVSAQR